MGFEMRCQRCGDVMEMKDPAAGQPWTLQQFWTCARCGRHFWTTYTSDPAIPPAPKPQPAAATPAAAAPAPAAPPAPTAPPTA